MYQIACIYALVLINLCYFLSSILFMMHSLTLQVIEVMQRCVELISMMLRGKISFRFGSTYTTVILILFLPEFVFCIQLNVLYFAF